MAIGWDEGMGGWGLGGMRACEWVLDGMGRECVGSGGVGRGCSYGWGDV